MIKLLIVRLLGVVFALIVAPILLSIDSSIPALNVVAWLAGLVLLLGGCILTFRSSLNCGKLYFR